MEKWWAMVEKVEMHSVMEKCLEAFILENPHIHMEVHMDGISIT